MRVRDLNGISEKSRGSAPQIARYMAGFREAMSEIWQFLAGLRMACLNRQHIAAGNADGVIGISNCQTAHLLASPFRLHLPTSTR